MQASSPPQEIDTPSLSASATPQPNTGAPSRKRKRAPATAASPAPSEQAANGTTDLLATSRADLSSRPILTISRGPVFVPDGPPSTNGLEWFKTEMTGVNRVGYRYIPAGINQPGCASPCRTIESNPTSFRVSWEDRSPYLRVTKDGLGIAGSKGFRSARCNTPIREGKWYMEVKILHGGGEHVPGGLEESKREGSHVRIGWGRREAPLNAPVGLDGYSYGYRDQTGDKVTLSRPRPYGRPFGSGDVVGMYISLPPRRPANPKDLHDPAHLKRERIPIDLKGQEVFEILEYPQNKEMSSLMDYSGKSTSSASVPSTNGKKTTAGGKLPERAGPGPQPGGPKVATPNLRPLPILPGSRVAFFVNGECQGVAFQDLYDYLPLRQSENQRKANSRKRTREGVKEHRENPFDDGTLGYYPFISLFNDASVLLNPGPDFEYPPPDDIDALLDGTQPMTMAEHKPSATVDEATAQTSSGSAQQQQSPTTDTHMTAATSMEDVKSPLSTLTPTSTLEPSQNGLNLTPTALHSESHSQNRTWRPASLRYPEFMAEEWAFDAREEAEAKSEMARLAAVDEKEEEKRKKRERERERRRKATEEKKREKENIKAKNEARDARTPAPGMIHTPSPLGLGILGVGLGHGHGHLHSTQPSPSPLRHSTSAYEPDHDRERTEEQEDRMRVETKKFKHEHGIDTPDFNGHLDQIEHPSHEEEHDHDPLLGPDYHEQEEQSSFAPSPYADIEIEVEEAHSGYTSENGHDHDEVEQDEEGDLDIDQELQRELEHELDQMQGNGGDNDMDVDQDIEATLA